MKRLRSGPGGDVWISQDVKHICPGGCSSSLQRGKFVFIGSVLRLSSCDISATHNPLREELAVSDISPVTARARALHRVTAIRSQLAEE